MRSPAVRDSPTSGLAAAGLSVVAKQIILPIVLAVVVPPLVPVYYGASNAYTAISMANKFIKTYQEKGLPAAAVDAVIQVGTSIVVDKMVSTTISPNVSTTLASVAVSEYKTFRPTASSTELAIVNETAVNAVSSFTDHIKDSISDMTVKTLENIVGV